MDKGQIKIVSHKYFEGVFDKNNTVKPMRAKEAREVLQSLGYVKIDERKEKGCIIEIWELPESLQTR
jgi:hypothetical protein